MKEAEAQANADRESQSPGGAPGAFEAQQRKMSDLERRLQAAEIGRSEVCVCVCVCCFDLTLANLIQLDTYSFKCAKLTCVYPHRHPLFRLLQRPD